MAAECPVCGAGRGQPHDMRVHDLAWLVEPRGASKVFQAPEPKRKVASRG